MSFHSLSIRLRAGLVAGGIFAVFSASCGSDTPAGPTTTAPVISCPAPVSAISADGQPTPVTFPAPSVSGGATPVTTACTPISASAFPVGTTSVSCAAVDAIQRRDSCTFNVTVTAAPKLQYTSFLAFGDSITAGEIPDPSDTPTSLFHALIVQPDKSYPVQLNTLLTKTFIGQTISVDRSGIQGETAENGLGRLPTVLAGKHYDVLLLLEGVNDLPGVCPPTNVQCAIPPAIDALRSMIIIAKSAGLQVIVCTLTPEIRGLYRAGAIDLLQPFNGQLVPMALNDGASYIDMYSLMLPQVNTLISNLDGLHPNEQGYLFMAQQFYNLIVSKYQVKPVPTRATPTTSLVPTINAASPARTNSSAKPKATGRD